LAVWRRGRSRRARSNRHRALIGFLNAGAATILKEEIDAFREGLRSLGHIEGRNVRFEYRFADGDLFRPWPQN
jgi:hypothetical protein